MPNICLGLTKTEFLTLLWFLFFIWYFMLLAIYQYLLCGTSLSWYYRALYISSWPRCKFVNKCYSRERARGKRAVLDLWHQVLYVRELKKFYESVIKGSKGNNEMFITRKDAPPPQTKEKAKEVIYNRHTNIFPFWIHVYL